MSEHEDESAVDALVENAGVPIPGEHRPPIVGDDDEPAENSSEDSKKP